MGFPYTEVSPVLRSLQSFPVSVPLYNNLWLTSLSPCVCVCVCVLDCGVWCSVVVAVLVSVEDVRGGVWGSECGGGGGGGAGGGGGGGAGGGGAGGGRRWW